MSRVRADFRKGTDIEYGSDPKTGVVGCYYTLAGLQKDTAAGSTLSSRLAVFFSGG